MRTIDADTLMPSFIKKANTMKDRHGVKLGEEWLLNYNDIKDVIDNAPTIDDLSEYSDKLWKLAYERGKAEGRKTGHWYEKRIDEQYGNPPHGFLTRYEWRCSECEDVPCYEYDIHTLNFCPNCGADMRGND